MLASCRYVQLGEGGRNLRRLARHNEHNVSISSKQVYQGGEVGVAHFHTLELALCLRATEFELLDDIRYSLKPVSVIPRILRAVKKMMKTHTYRQIIEDRRCSLIQ